MPVTVTFSSAERITGRFQLWAKAAGSGKWQLIVKAGRDAVVREAESAEALLRKAMRLGAGMISVRLREAVEEEQFRELLEAAEHAEHAEEARLPCIRIWIRKKAEAAASGIKEINPYSLTEGWEKDGGAADDPACSRELTKRQWQESFRGYLLHLVDERGMKDPQVYKRANVDRRLFSKIRCGQNYRPGKNVILALAMALELNLEETRELLARAGKSLSKTDERDRIFVAFIHEQNYSLMEINRVLFSCRLPLLGGTVLENR